MIDHRGEPVVMDFGLARRSNHEDVRITREGAISGSPAYMSPEQLEGKVADVDPRSDIYSLGVLFYEGLTGTLPFKGGGSIVVLITEVISKQPTHPREVRRDLDPRICDICMRAMARNPHERFTSMQEMAVALDKFLKVYSASSLGQNEIEDDVDIPLNPEIGLAESKEDSLPLGSSSDLIRQKCKKVRVYLEQKEFEKAVSLLKKIADEKDLRFAKYAKWAATELPRIRGVMVASQDAALSAMDIPVLAPLEEDILWEGSSDDLSASAQLRPRERGTAGTKRNKRPLLLIGAVIVLIGVIGILTLVLVL
jgi:serine/threonine protein kinase